MKKAIIIVIVILIAGGVSYEGSAQITHFSQFFSTPMTIAPSFAGYTEASRLSINYRDQWPQIPGTFVTYAIAGDHYFKRAKSGIGIMIFRDQAGTGKLSLTEGGLQYAYRIKIGEKRGYKNNEWFIRPGIQLKFAQRALNFDDLTFIDQLLSTGQTTGGNTTQPRPAESIGYLDLTGSALAYNDLYWGGFAVDHLLTPNQSLTADTANVEMKFSVFGGAKIPLKNKKTRMQKIRYGRKQESVNFVGHYRYQGGTDQLDLGAYWERDPLVLGAWFRGIPIKGFKVNNGDNYENIDALIALIGIHFKNNMSIGYSFDVTISRLLNHTGGSHEISIVYRFNQNAGNPRDMHTIIPCPAF